MTKNLFSTFNLIQTFYGDFNFLGVKKVYYELEDLLTRIFGKGRVIVYHSL